MISVRYLYSITQRSQFCRFGRALSPLNQAAPFHDEERFMKIAEGIPRVRNLKKTCDLISSPGGLGYIAVTQCCASVEEYMFDFLS